MVSASRRPRARHWKYLVAVQNCNWRDHECDLLMVTGNPRIIDVEIKISQSEAACLCGHRPRYNGALHRSGRRARLGDDAMSEQPIWCYDDDTVETAKSLMEAKMVRRVLVLDKDKQLVGVVSLGDIAFKAGNAGGMLANVLESARPAR